MLRTTAYTIALLTLAACSEGPTAAVALNDPLLNVAYAGTPDLAGCDNLTPPAGSTPHVRLYAAGVQIYRWNGTAWAFVAPEADLFASANLNGKVGTHFAGPTWEQANGSNVVGTVVDRCTPNANAIPWLILSGVANDRSGLFKGVKAIQRLATTGGKAPASNGTQVGEEARVPYTAEYYFYR